MPKIAELREIDGALWAKLDIDLASKDQPVSLLVQSEIDAIRRDERNGIIEVISWFENVENFTGDDIIARIRAMI